MAGDQDFELGIFLPYLLNRAAEESSAVFARIYKDRYGLLRTEWRVLFHLGQQGEMTATEIGRRSRIHKTKISRAVAGLQKRRLLKKVRLAHDRRSEALTLTPSGLKIFDALSDAAKTYNDHLLEKIPEAERSALIANLHRLLA